MRIDQSFGLVLLFLLSFLHEFNDLELSGSCIGELDALSQRVHWYS